MDLSTQIEIQKNYDSSMYCHIYRIRCDRISFNDVEILFDMIEKYSRIIFAWSTTSFSGDVQELHSDQMTRTQLFFW